MITLVKSIYLFLVFNNIVFYCYHHILVIYDPIDSKANSKDGIFSSAKQSILGSATFSTTYGNSINQDQLDYKEIFHSRIK